MELLVLSGERRTMLHYEQYSQHLMDELGVKPDEKTQSLYERILSNGKFLQPPEKPCIAENGLRFIGDCPYQGLSAFLEKDARFFFGREAFVDQLVNNLANNHPVIMVVGASGSGKSSIVQAGLLPRLRNPQGWLIASLRPAGQPFLKRPRY